MLNTLVAIVLGNAVVATLFAVGVLLLARWYHKPALLHALWVVVLLKLVTPPMFTIPVPVEAIGLDSPVLEIPPEETIRPERSTQFVIAESSEVTGETQAAATETIFIEAPPAEADPFETGSQINESPMPEFPEPGETVLAETSDAAAKAQSIPETADSNPPNEPAVGTNGFPAAAPGGTIETAAVQTGSAFSGRDLALILLGVWGLGASVVFHLAWRQILRFERSLRRAEPAGGELSEWVRRLALQMGLKRAPEVFLLEGTVSPMLWGFGRKPRLLLPRELLLRLDPDAAETLILHELAHMRRGDHWVRVLELFCQCVYWWHPLVWWSRKQLRIVEEECCDAFVVEHCSGGVYAHALLTTVDFLSHRKLALPPGASGMSHLEFLKRRLTMIMQGGVRAQLAGLPKYILLATAVVGLSVLPRFVATTAQAAFQEPADAEASEAEPVTEVEVKPTTKAAPRAKSNAILIGQEAIEFDKTPKGYPTAQLEVRDLDFSPDGKLLAAGYGKWDTTGEVVIYDFPQKKVIKKFPLPRGVASTTFSPDGKYLATSHWNNHLEIRETATWDLLVAKTLATKVSRLSFSPDGKYLAACGEDGYLSLLTVGEWDKERAIEGDLFRFQKVAFSHDSKLLAAVGGSFSDPRFGRGLVFEVETGKQLAKIETDGAVMASAAFSPDGKELATGEYGTALRFWEPTTGKPLSVIQVGGTMDSLEYTPDGTLVGPSFSGQVYLIKDQKILRNLSGHEGRSLTARISPDGKTLVSGGIDALIRIWNPETGVPQGVLRPNSSLDDSAEAVLAIAHSPDGRFVATTHEDGSTRIRNAVNGEFLRQVEGHEDVVAAASFSPDSQTLATGSYDQTVKLWNVETGEEIRNLAGHDNWVFSVEFSPDGKTLASGGYDKSIRLWEVKTGESSVLEGHTAAVRSLAFSPDGKQLASGGSDRNLRIWDLESSKVLHELKGHTAAVRAVAFSPDGDQVASGSEDKTIRVWNVKTGESQQELKGHTGMVWALSYSPRGRTLASGGFDNTLRIWNAENGASLQTLSGHQDVITSLSYAPNSSAIITGSYDKTLKLWQALEPPIPALADLNLSDQSDTPNVRFVVFTPDGKRMITGNQNRQIRLWDLASGRVIKTVMQPRGIGEGELTPDGKLLATAGYGGALYLFDAQTLELLATFDNETKDNASVAISPDGKRLASGAWDGSITLWNVETREKIRELPKQELPIEGLSFSPDGKLLASATGNYKEHLKVGTVKLWNTETWEEAANLLGPKQKMRGVHFTPDGKTLVANGSQHELLVYNLADRKLTKQISFGTEVSSVAFLPDSQTAVLSGWDGRVELWSIQTGTRLAKYDGHQPANQNHRYVFDVAASPDGSVVVSAGGDGHVKLWPTSSLPPVKPLLTTEKVNAESFHVAIAPDGSRFVVARSDKIVEIRDTKTGEILKTISGLDAHVSGVAFAPDGKSFAGAMAGGKAAIWDAASGSELLSVEGHEGGSRRVAFSPDGTMLATCGWDETAAVWNIADGKLRYRLPKQGLSVSDVKFSPEGKLLVTSTGSFREWQKPGVIKVWNAEDGSFFRQIDEHGGEIKGVALNPGGRYLVSFGGGGAKVWNRIDSKPVKAVGSGTVTAAVFSPDGQTLFAGHASGEVMAYDLQTGRIKRTLEGHDSLVHGAAISDDGTLLITSSKDGTVKLWPAMRTPAIPLVDQVRDDPNESFAIAYSPERELIAVGGKDKTISLIDAKTNQVLRELSGHNGLVFRMAFVPGGKELLSGGSDGTVRLWNVETGEQIVKWTAHGEMLAAVRSVAVSVDGKRLAAGNWEGETYVWGRDSDDPIFQLPKQSLPVTGIAFSPDGSLLATSTGSWKQTNMPGELSLWDAKTGELITKLEGHAGEIKGIVFNESGDTLISFSTDKTIRFWDVAAKKQIRQHDHDRNVNALAIHQDLVAFGDFQGGVYLLDLKHGLVRMQTGGHYMQLAGAAFSADGSRFYTVALDGFFKTWATKPSQPAVRLVSTDRSDEPAPLAELIRDWQPLVSGAVGNISVGAVRLLEPHGDKVWFAVYSPDGKTLASGGDDKTVKLWDAETFELKATLQGHKAFTSHVAFSPDGSKIASVSWDADRTVKLWEVATGKLLASAQAHEAGCRRVAFSPDGKYIATASEDGSVRIFTEELVLSQSIALGNNVYCLAFSPDGNVLAVGTGNWQENKQGKVTLFDPETGKMLKELENSEGHVFHLQFLKDSKHLLANNAGVGCAVWNIDTGKIEETYRQEQDTRWVEVSRDEKLVIASVRPGMVQIWNRNESQPLATFKASEKFVHCATFSPDGKLVVVGAEDGGLWVWEMKKIRAKTIARSTEELNSD